ncbi:hypothetical protein Pla111_34020 [Botrimarina hoheduenensis]|uniref:Uncharacterized protein n=1 Tax=Botrimarina hoheduenensis TaxID=2528000 RepID=A0A5C5VR33_9BACT|nr:hypothetical protein Pla111_34020 [Botrimarina hoheduenensis]
MAKKPTNLSDKIRKRRSELKSARAEMDSLFYSDPAAWVELQKELASTFQLAAQATEASLDERPESSYMSYMVRSVILPFLKQIAERGWSSPLKQSHSE